MIVQSRMFGEVEIDEEKVYHFPSGLLGFEDLETFALIEAEELKPLAWLLPLDEPDLAFPMADPRYFVQNYEVPVVGEDRDGLEVEESDEIVIYTIVTLPDEGRPLTANLRGPVVLNLRNRRGRQIVLLDERYSHRQPALAEGAAVQAK